MSVIRAFIAVELPPEITACLAQVIGQLQDHLKGVPVRWVAPENIHLTLKFLGDVSPGNLHLLTDMLRAEADTQCALEISVGGVGAFPKVRNPRVIWVGVEAPQELHALQRGIEAQTTRLGYAPDDRRFSPHLTLGRVAHNASSSDVRQIGDVLNHYKVGFLGAAKVRVVHLFRSDLQPSGAVYTKLFSAPLSN
jgi:2'-5' RNA ligase